MTKHRIPIDRQLLARAQNMSGEATVTDIVNIALRRLAGDDVPTKYEIWHRDSINVPNPYRAMQDVLDGETAEEIEAAEKGP